MRMTGSSEAVRLVEQPCIAGLQHGWNEGLTEERQYRDSDARIRYLLAQRRTGRKNRIDESMRLMLHAARRVLGMLLLSLSRVPRAAAAYPRVPACVGTSPSAELQRRRPVSGAAGLLEHLRD